MSKRAEEGVLPEHSGRVPCALIRTFSDATDQRIFWMHRGDEANLRTWGALESGWTDWEQEQEVRMANSGGKALWFG